MLLLDICSLFSSRINCEFFFRLENSILSLFSHISSYRTFLQFLIVLSLEISELILLSLLGALLYLLQCQCLRLFRMLSLKVLCLWVVLPLLLSILMLNVSTKFSYVPVSYDDAIHDPLDPLTFHEVIVLDELPQVQIYIDDLSKHCLVGKMLSELVDLRTIIAKTKTTWKFYKGDVEYL